LQYKNRLRKTVMPERKQSGQDYTLQESQTAQMGGPEERVQRPL